MTTEIAGKMGRKIEMAANVAIVIVAIVVVVVFLKSRNSGSPAQSPTISAGTELSLKGVNWQETKKHVVLALSTSCHFCSESGPFYQELTRACREKGVHTIAVLPQTSKDAAAYLKGLGVSVDEIRQVPLSSIQVPSTPTLLFVDGKGIVRKVWVGKLPSESQKEVLAQLPDSTT